MKYLTLQDVPRPLRKFYRENSLGGVEVKPIPEEKTLMDLERVTGLGKPSRVIQVFSDKVVEYTPWLFYKDFVVWLRVCEEVDNYNQNLPVIGVDAKGVEILAPLKVKPPEPLEVISVTAEDLAKPYLMRLKKLEREALVKALTVEVEGMVFDGDEVSQDRMNRAINSLVGTTETVVWVLANNTAVEVNKATLKKALRAAGQAQTAIWLMPY